MNNQPMSPLGAFMFGLAKDTMQAQLGEAYEGVPRFEPTAQDINRMSAEKDEERSEGRAIRPFRTNFKE